MKADRLTIDVTIDPAFREIVDEAKDRIKVLRAEADRRGRLIEAAIDEDVQGPIDPCQWCNMTGVDREGPMTTWLHDPACPAFTPDGALRWGEP